MRDRVAPDVASLIRATLLRLRQMNDRNPPQDAPIPRADPARRFAARRAEIDRAIARVLASGRFILGAEVAAFETEFADFLGARHAVGVASGTQALALALAALGIKPGDEVVTVAMTFVATAIAIEEVGAKPVFVDVDPQTRCMDPGLLDAAIGPATAAILPVHLHGIPAAMSAIVAIAQRHGLAVVEDCAHAHGASIGGRRTGTFGHAAAFSFYPTKGLGALGDAGAVVTNDAAIAARLRRLRNYGFDEAGRSIEPGTNARLDEMQAAILRVLLPDLDEQNAQRRALAAEYRARLANAALALPPADDGAVYHQYAVALEARDAVRERLLAHHRIDTGIHYPLAVHQHPRFARPIALPVTERLAREFLSLPIQPEVATGEVGRIADALLESIDACR
jgi:dTDP-3-amino-3,4,6-trideoxy-alpha-D-glucose transaminase